MLKHLKFKTKDSNVFFFSDLHISHAKNFILDPRGFKDIEEAQRVLTERWNNKVTNNDIVFLLGDTVVGAGDKALEIFEELLISLNYKAIYIMPGNHHSGYRMFFDRLFNNGGTIDYYQRLSTNFCKSYEKYGEVHLIPNYYEIVVDGIFMVLSHYAIASFNMQATGFHVHGHCHGNLVKTPIGEILYKNRILDVGPESVESPISFAEVKAIMDARMPVKVDHH